MLTPHNTGLYQIGKGILYIAPWTGQTPPTDPDDYVDVGNASSIEVEPTVETKPHYGSRSGFKDKDKNPVVQTEYVVNFTLDEIASANLEKFTLGTLDGYVIHGLTNANKEWALKFVSDNPIGENQTWKMWRTTIKPGGAIALVGEEYMEMSYTAEGLSDSANHPASPYFDVKIHTTTTTSSTTTTTTTV